MMDDRQPVLESAGCAQSSAPAAARSRRSTVSTSSVAAGETVALVGESGSGKSVTSLSVMGLLTRNVGAIAAGQYPLQEQGRRCS